MSTHLPMKWLGLWGILGGLLATACSTPQAGPEPRPGNTGSTQTQGQTQPTQTAPSATNSAAPTSPANASTPTGTGAPSLNLNADCPGLTSQFDAVLKGSTGQCSTDLDCGCYPDLRMDGKLGVTSKTAAEPLTALSNAYRQKQCPTMFMSSAKPPVCSPTCQSGVCK